MTQFHIGDRVRIHDRRFGELTGTVLFLSEDYITARLDKPRKKVYPTDRAYEFTAPKRLWSLVPHFEVKTSEGSFRLHNHKAQALSQKKEALDKWREECLQSSQS
jgi:hypothetical protein